MCVCRYEWAYYPKSEPEKPEPEPEKPEPEKPDPYFGFQATVSKIIMGKSIAGHGARITRITRNQPSPSTFEAQPTKPFISVRVNPTPVRVLPPRPGGVYVSLYATPHDRVAEARGRAPRRAARRGAGAEAGARPIILSFETLASK